MTADNPILLVEDDALIAMMVADMCDALGHGEPVQAASVAEALEALETRNGRRFAVALLDVHLGMDTVWPVADALASAAIPFAFMTGGGGTVPPGHAGRPTLGKPFRVAELDSLLTQLIDTNRA